MPIESPRSRRPATRLARAVAALALPAILGASLLGCPWFKKKDDASATAGSASASASVVAPAPSPMTIISEPSLSATASASAGELDDDDDAAALGDASLGPDADGGDAKGDALDGEVGDAKADAKKDAGKAAAGIKKLDDEYPVKGKRKVTTTNANVHRAPKDGVTMTTLAKGSEVKLLAQYFDWFRVSFTDPLTGKKAQGWVYGTNFIGPRRKSCPESWTYHFDKDGGWCERECSKKADCKALKDYKCSGGSCYYDGE